MAVWLAASVAAADPPRTMRLASSGPCDLTSVEPRTSELLGRSALAEAARAHVDVVTAQTADAATATLTFVDENGAAQPPRDVSAASCDELAESIAIVISLVLREEPPAAPPPPAPPPPPPTVQDDSRYVAPSSAVPTKAIELGVATSSGRQSALVLGGRLERRHTAFAADLELVMPTSVEVLQGAVHVASARADVGACLRARGFSGCALLGGGVVRGRGEDLMESRTAVGPLATAVLRSEWRQPVSRRLGVRVFASVEQVLVRPSFRVGDVAVWTTPLLQAWLGGGIFLQMP